jgi:hypothetical protein
MGFGIFFGRVLAFEKLLALLEATMTNRYLLSTLSILLGMAFSSFIPCRLECRIAEIPKFNSSPWVSTGLLC